MICEVKRSIILIYDQERQNKLNEKDAALDFKNGLGIQTIAEIYGWNLIQTMMILEAQGCNLAPEIKSRREGGSRRTKLDILAEIAQKLDITLESVQSLEKADKSALETLSKAL